MKKTRLLRTFVAGSVFLFTAGLVLQGSGAEDQVGELKQRLKQLEEAHQRELAELEAAVADFETAHSDDSGLMAKGGGAASGSNPAAAPAGAPFQPAMPGPGAREAFIDISAIGTFSIGTSTEQDVRSLQKADHDPGRRGFDLQSLELAMSGYVDPYFRAQTNLIFDFDPDEHGDRIEIEEAFMETLALPANLQLRVGQFFTEFGRHNTQHLHFWDFVDTPVVMTRMFGPDGLRNPGARLSWLAPTPFYSELFFTVQDSTGETAYSFRNDEGFLDSHVQFNERARVDSDRGEEIRKMRDLLYTARYAASWDLTVNQTVLAGVSGATGPNASTEDTFDNGNQIGEGRPSGRTDIYGTDVYWKWTPPHQTRGFPFVSFQTEALMRRFELRDPSETFEDYGLYAQALYGFRPMWVAGLRYDGVRGDMKDVTDRGGETIGLANRTRISPNMTWYPSEFSKIRLQYNYDDRSGFGKDHSVWLQFEFSIGPHGAHTF